MENQSEIIIFMVIGVLATALILVSIFTFFLVHKKKMFEKEAKITEIEKQKELDLAKQEAKIAEIEKQKELDIAKAINDSEDRQKEKIAREIHDNMVASLTVVARGLDKSITDSKLNRLNIEQMDKDLALLEETITGLRNISHDLIPVNILSFGLISALQIYVESITVLTTKFEDKTNFAGKLPFSFADQNSIFKICKEILNNLLKHEKFSFLKISIENVSQNLVIDFIHNGKGITNDIVKEHIKSPKSIGLSSINYRAKLLNALVDYSVEDKVASVCLTIPY